MTDEQIAVHHQTLESYFFEEIENARERTGRDVPDDVEAYVVSLLARFARRTQAAGRSSRPLALDYLRAKSQSGSSRTLALRGVGDRALYISGVVPRSLHRSAVNVKYVQGIGEAAYREVAGRGALAVLGMLAENFTEIAALIGDVVEPEANSEHDLLGLYERWRQNGDPRDAKRLVAAGVVLINAEGNDTVQ